MGLLLFFSVEMSTFVLPSLFVTKIILYFFPAKEIPKKIVHGPKRWTFFYVYTKK